jgi:hypothetical protein
MVKHRLEGAGNPVGGSPEDIDVRLVLPTIARTIAGALLLAAASGCGAGPRLAPAVPSYVSDRQPAANPPAALRDPERLTSGRPTFSKPRISGRPTSFSWVFASDSSLHVFDETTGEQLSECYYCNAGELAVSPKSGDLAITGGSSITVWHVSLSGVVQFATMSSSSSSAGALAYDNDGDLYAVSGSNAIDLFTSKEIASGSGGPARTLEASSLASISHLATRGHALLVQGSTASAYNVVISVNPKTGANTFLQSLNGSPHGIVVDGQHNLLINGDRNIQIFKEPWTGLPIKKWTLGAKNHFELSFDATRTLLWIPHLAYPYEPWEPATDVLGYVYTGSGRGMEVGYCFLQESGCGFNPYFSAAVDPQPQD